MRRSCYLEPVLGEGEASLNHFCGGHIDPSTLSNVPYITRDGRNVTVKGYICPLGQVCKVCQIHGVRGTLVLILKVILYQEGSNPQSNIMSFDTIYYSALQVFVIATANSVSRHPRSRIGPLMIYLP